MMKKYIILAFIVFVARLNLFSQQTITLDETRAFNLGQLMEKNNVLSILPIDIDKEGDSLFILEFRFSYILKVDLKTGALQKLISSKGQGPTELNFPTSLRVKDGLVYVSDRGYGGVKIFDARSGTLVKVIKINANFDDIDVYQNGDLVLKKIDPVSNSLICRFDKEGNKIGDIVPLNLPQNRTEGVDYIKDTFVKFRLDPKENLILLKPLRRKILKYDGNGKLLWERTVDNSILREKKEKDKISIDGSAVSVTYNVFDVAVDEKGNIIVGHNGGGQVFSPSGDSLLLFKGQSLNHLLVSGNRLIAVNPNGIAYIYEIPNI